jgi:TolB protein
MRTILRRALLPALGALTLWAQQSDILIKITGRERPRIAIPDFRGTGEAQAQMGTFNSTLSADIRDSGYFDLLPKTSFPLQVPQRPQDLKPPVNNQRSGPWLTDWSTAPVNADYLAFGYTAPQGGRLVLFGYLYNVRQPDLANAQAIAKVYTGTMDAEGARKVAHEFAADILALAGAQTLVGTKIYFTSSRSGSREVWSMDYDGAGQKQLTNLKSICMNPAISLDGTRLAFTTFTRTGPSIMLLSTQTNRQLPFYNQRASLNATPAFLPSGQILFASTAAGDFSGLKRITESRAIEVHPRANPKNPNEIVFVSGRSGTPQIYRMNLDGTDVVRLTSGEGEAVQPAWSPNGQFIAFAWTRGFAPGNYNVFVMDTASRTYVQLTHGAGRNENPAWAPDGRHLVFTSDRGGATQIWTMLADGTQAKALTTEGRNEQAVWGPPTN